MLSKRICAMGLVVLMCVAAPGFGVTSLAAEKKPHVVFVVGDHEYGSEVTMPLLAKELEEHFGMKCTMRMARPDAKTSNSIPGLEVLKEADAAVIFLRFRALPEEQFKLLMDYINSGGRVVAFRTSTHALKYPKGHKLEEWNTRFGLEVLGQKWLRHSPHPSSVDAWTVPEQAGHPILKGIPKTFRTPGALYWVKPLPESTRWLVMGAPCGHPAIKEVTKEAHQPVAWVWKPKGGRVFYSSLLAFPDAWKSEPVRRLAVNAVHWVMDRPVPDWKQ